MRRAWLLGLGLFGLMGPGCAPSGVCDQNKDPELAPDGGVYACVASETCPRDSLPICLDTNFPQATCVACVAQQCLRITPVECDG